MKRILFILFLTVINSTAYFAQDKYFNKNNPEGNYSYSEIVVCYTKTNSLPTFLQCLDREGLPARPIILKQKNIPACGCKPLREIFEKKNWGMHTKQIFPSIWVKEVYADFY